MVVDFIDLAMRTARARVLAALREGVADDSTAVQVFPMSRFGLVEMSRKRIGPSMAEMLGRPCPACEGAGTLPALRWRAEHLFHQLAELSPGRVTVLAAPDLHDYLNGTGKGAWEAVASRYGISLTCDQSLAPGGHRIEELS